MTSSARGNGSAFNLQKDTVIISRDALEKGEHPEIREGIAHARQWFDRRLEQIRIVETEEKGIICREYEEGVAQLEQEHAKKLKELEESFFKELDEQNRSLDSEVNALDIAILPLGNGEESLTNCATQLGQCQHHPNPLSANHGITTAISGKKFLRSRQNDVIPSSSVGAESALHLGAIGLTDSAGTAKRRTQTKKSGSPFGFLGFGRTEGAVGGFAGAIGGGPTIGGTSTSSLMLPYLLSESEISEDVHSLGSDSANHCHLAERSSAGGGGLSQDGAIGDGVALSGIACHSTGGEMAEEEGGEKAAGASGRHHRRVLLEQNKLILDGKTFHRFQNVYIGNEGRYVEFRSGIPGDTRTFTATKDDLESGRVFAHQTFRRAEFDAICQIQGISVVPNSPSDGIHIQSFEFQNDEFDVFRLLERTVLVKAAYELIAEGDGHEQVMAKLASDPSSSLARFDFADQSWSLLVRPHQKKHSGDYARSVVERYTAIPLLTLAPVDLAHPSNVFSVIEMYEANERRETPDKVYFVRLVSLCRITNGATFPLFWLGEGRGNLKTLFSLSHRRYIGNSTMDPELAFIQANLAKTRPGALAMDPFCGTGGLLLPAAYFGSYVFGAEIKWDVARARGRSSRAGEQWLCADHSIRANFEQYGLCDGRFLGVILADSSQPKLWHNLTTVGTIDAIITDPPYGIRERGQRLGSDKRKTPKENEIGNGWHKNGQTESAEKDRKGNSSESLAKSAIKKNVGNEDQIDHFGVGFPEKQKYAMSNVFLDLMDLSARLLRPGGRLAFWFPVCRSEYSDRILPRMDCMQLVCNCEQTLAKDSSRRLLVYEKLRRPLTDGRTKPSEKAFFELDCYAEKTFHQKVFGSIERNEAKEKC
ncbi:hypothetical protein niasHT_010353 [Heterodera trifolii]|uniref:tRNA (guanine(10)-N(2))-methyltransferase TRMT11 n=1 Tax=Heterodera trifolii TaxID=157864 RepID=A0ABD2M6P7_9BILA